MQTMAEAWIEEGKTIGLQKGREEGKFQERIDVIIRLLRGRFQPSEETLQTLAQQLTQIRQEAVLSQLVDLALDVLVLPDFMTAMLCFRQPGYLARPLRRYRVRRHLPIARKLTIGAA